MAKILFNAKKYAESITRYYDEVRETLHKMDWGQLPKERETYEMLKGLLNNELAALVAAIFDAEWDGRDVYVTPGELALADKVLAWATAQYASSTA